MQAGCKNQINARFSKEMNTTYEYSLFRTNKMTYEFINVLNKLSFTTLSN